MRPQYFFVRSIIQLTDRFTRSINQSIDRLQFRYFSSVPTWNKGEEKVIEAKVGQKRRSIYLFIFLFFLFLHARKSKRIFPFIWKKKKIIDSQWAKPYKIVWMEFFWLSKRKSPMVIERLYIGVSTDWRILKIRHNE